jgi:hypothetical protein
MNVLGLLEGGWLTESLLHTEVQSTELEKRRKEKSIALRRA